jgi:sn1-specific diacylglycerol lipase
VFQTSFLFIAAAVLSREAARYTEDFTFSVGVGDDFVMRLSIDSAEDLRTTLHHVLEASHLPKVNEHRSLLC